MKRGTKRFNASEALCQCDRAAFSRVCCDPQNPEFKTGEALFDGIRRKDIA
jgi:hypothetical protein